MLSTPRSQYSHHTNRNYNPGREADHWKDCQHSSSKYQTWAHGQEGRTNWGLTGTEADSLSYMVSGPGPGQRGPQGPRRHGKAHQNCDQKKSQHSKYFVRCVPEIICLLPQQDYLILKLARKFRQNLSGIFTSSECKCFTKIAQLWWDSTGKLPPDKLWNFLGVLPAHLHGSSIKHLLGPMTMNCRSSRGWRTNRWMFHAPKILSVAQQIEVLLFCDPG